MAFSWKLYGKSENIDSAMLQAASDILSTTAAVHKDRDLKIIDSVRLIYLINNFEKSKDDGFNYNWMKVHYGTNDGTDPNFTGNGNLVIIYRLIQHRRPKVGSMQWSVTVGFDERLLPDPKTKPEDPLYPLLAVEFSKAIKDFFSDLGLPPVFIMIDDKPIGADKPRESKIGNLIYQAKHFSDGNAYPDLKADWSGPEEYTPRTTQGGRIPGYSNPSIVTTVTPLS